jgi:Tfp pilus assembly protein PilF
LLREGHAHQQAGRLQPALELYQRVLRSQPDNVDALNLLGTLALQGGRPDMAAQALQQAISIKPDVGIYHSNLGNALRALSRLKEAETQYQEALRLMPDYAHAYSNLGVCLKEQNRMEEAVASFRKALELDSQNPRAWGNLGNILRDLGRFDEALPCLEKDVALNPEFAESRFRLAGCLLAQGNLKRGWEEYAWRFRKEEYPMPARPFTPPPWQGEPLAGKSLLVWSEQGVGDEILFAETVRDAVQSGAKVWLECDPRLVPLFARSWPGATVVARSDPPSPELSQRTFDFSTPAGNLARWFRSSVDLFPTEAGFLHPDATRVAFWKNWLANQGARFSLGISWRSMQRNADRNSYYTDLNQWGAIFKTPGVTFVNLQYGECEDELLEAERLFGVSIHRPPGLNLKDDLDDAAALTRGLDLVIGPKTSVTAMAGAVGTPTWLLNLDNDWTMLGTDAVPWFPSVQVFLKSWDEPWEPLLGRVAERLAERVLRIPIAP